MKNESISERQATILIILFLLGNSFLVGSGNQNLLVLGSETVSRFYFQSTMAVGLIRFGFLQRLELTVTIVFLVCIFIKISICIFAVCNGISKVFGFDDHKFIATPVAFLMLSFSFFVYNGTMEAKFFDLNIWAYYSFPFEVIIPFVIFIVAEIKSRRSTNTKTA